MIKGRKSQEHLEESPHQHLLVPDYFMTSFRELRHSEALTHCKNPTPQIPPEIPWFGRHQFVRGALNQRAGFNHQTNVPKMTQIAPPLWIFGGNYKPWGLTTFYTPSSLTHGGCYWWIFHQLDTRWWFETFFISTRSKGNDPTWRAYFWDGLKPPPIG